MTPDTTIADIEAELATLSAAELRAYLAGLPYEGGDTPAEQIARKVLDHMARRALKRKAAS